MFKLPSKSMSPTCIRMRARSVLLLLLSFCVVVGLATHWPAPAQSGGDGTNVLRHRFKIPKASVPGFRQPRPVPAIVAIGERLFLETRFSQFFFARAHGDANATLLSGDPVVDRTVTAGGSLSGPFAGFAINCRSCHFVNE